MNFEDFADQIRSYAPAWWRVTLFGEPTMMIPVAVVVVIWLWLACSRRIALWWGALLVLGGAILVAQKLLYYVGGISLTSIRLYTISGHSVAASYVYGSLIAIIARNWPRWLRYAGWLAVALLVLAIGVSRVAVAGHRISEAVSGLAIGTLLLVWFLRFIWRRAAPRYPVWTLALPCLVVMALTHGHVYEFETIFRRLGRWARPGVNFYRER